VQGNLRRSQRRQDERGLLGSDFLQGWWSLWQRSQAREGSVSFFGGPSSLRLSFPPFPPLPMPWLLYAVVEDIVYRVSCRAECRLLCRAVRRGRVEILPT
jgi:hypothetical protein